MARGKRWGAVLTVALVLALVLSGCGSNGNGGGNGNGKGKEGTNAAGSGSSSGGDGNQQAGSVKLSVTGMPKYAPNKLPNMYVDEVEKRFNMDWDYEAIPLSAGLEKYNVMFASGDYPDFIPNMNSPSSVAKWAAAGYLLPIGDYIDRIPNYRKLFTDDDWSMLLDFANTGGKLYTLPNVAANDPMTWIYRKDAFDKIGVTSFPTTLDGLHDALVKLKAQYPDSVGIGVRGGTANTGINNLMNGFRQAFRNPNSTQTFGFWNDPDAANEVVWNMATDKHRQMLAYLAGLYKEGLIEKEFATLTQDQWTTKRLTGKVLVDFQWASHTVDPTYELKDIPGGQWEYARTLPSASDQPALEFKPANFSLFGPIFSKKLKDEPEKLDKLLEYIDWASTPEGELFHQMGIEGVTYTKQDGKISYKEDFNRKKVAEEYGFDWMIKQSDEVLNSDPVALKKKEAMKELAGIYTVTPKSAPLTEDEQQTVNTTVSAIQDVAYQFATKAVMGIIDVNNDDVWNGYLSDLDKVGFQNALDIYAKYLKKD